DRRYELCMRAKPNPHFPSERRCAYHISRRLSAKFEDFVPGVAPQARGRRFIDLNHVPFSSRLRDVMAYPLESWLRPAYELRGALASAVGAAILVARPEVFMLTPGLTVAGAS